MQEFDGQGKWGGEDEANGDDEEDDEEDQVWSLSQFNSVGFLSGGRTGGAWGSQALLIFGATKTNAFSNK